ncbi:MAG: hypothetical protein RLZZ116_1569 [Planctomycetota bacterium]|jgi:hypothetical protein
MRYTPVSLALPAALPAALIALALASCANAQEPPVARSESRQSFAYQMSNGDGSSVELRIENGEVVVAKIDGKSIPPDRVRKSGDGYEILGEDGKVLRRIAAGAQIPPRADARPRVRVQRDAELGRSIEPRRAPEPRRDAEPAAAPKSMIGVGLGSPDPALVHHLKIDRANATMVTNVVDGLPADAAGIEQFDVIVSVNGDRKASSENLRRVLREAEPGAKIALEVLRGSETRKVEVTAIEFDGEKLAFAEPLEVQGFPMEPGEVFAFEGGDADGGGMMFFIGPDGQRREMRMPVMPGMPMMPNGFDPAQMEEFERAMDGFNRRMEEWSRRMEQRMRDGGPDGRLEPNEQREMRPRDNDERLRRMEERLDQIMRELERERAANRDRKKDA